MFGDLYAPIFDVKDLSPDDRLWLAVSQMSAALRTGKGRVNDDLIGLCHLSERRSAMAELSAGLVPSLSSEASGARGLLPRRIE